MHNSKGIFLDQKSRFFVVLASNFVVHDRGRVASWYGGGLHKGSICINKLGGGGRSMLRRYPESNFSYWNLSKNPAQAPGSDVRGPHKRLRFPWNFLGESEFSPPYGKPTRGAVTYTQIRKPKYELLHIPPCRSNTPLRVLTA